MQCVLKLLNVPELLKVMLMQLKLLVQFTELKWANETHLNHFIANFIACNPFKLESWSHESFLLACVGQGFVVPSMHCMRLHGETKC